MKWPSTIAPTLCSNFCSSQGADGRDGTPIARRNASHQTLSAHALLNTTGSGGLDVVHAVSP